MYNSWEYNVINIINIQWQHYNLFKKRKYCCTIKFTVPEVKVLLILCYMVLLGTVVLLNYVIWNNASEKIVHDEIEYFKCQLFGDDPTCESIRHSRSFLESVILPHVNKVVFITVALFSWVQLLLAIQFQDVKRISVKWKGTCIRRSTKKSSMEVPIVNNTDPTHIELCTQNSQ